MKLPYRMKGLIELKQIFRNDYPQLKLFIVIRKFPKKEIL